MDKERIARILSRFDNAEGVPLIDWGIAAFSPQNRNYILTVLSSPLAAFVALISDDIDDFLRTMKIPEPIDFDREYLRKIASRPNRDELSLYYVKQLYGIGTDDWDYMTKLQEL